LAFINNFFNATLIFISGFLIEHFSYNAGYTLGIAMSALGCLALFLYRYLAKATPSADQMPYAK